MCKRNLFLEKICFYRFKYYQENEGNIIKDVYDGINYREVFRKGFLSDLNFILFLLNIDGV